MSNTTVFDSKINELKTQMKKLLELKVEKEGVFTNLLSIFGRASVSEDTVKEHNRLIDETIQSYTENMNTMLGLTAQMKKEGLYNNVIMERMSDYINKLESLLDIQKANIEKSNNIISNHKNTIAQLQQNNDIIKTANQTLTTQNKAQQAQNERQQKQNAAQQKTIAGMEGNLSQLKKNLEDQRKKLEKQTTEIKIITDSNAELSKQLTDLKATQAETERNAKIAAAKIVNLKEEQAAHIKDIKAAQKIRVLFLKNSAKNKLKLQSRAFLDRIAEIKENSNNSIADKEAEIKKITEQHNIEQNEINTQLTKLTATSNATIGDLKKELSSFKTEEKLSKEDQEKQKKMLSGVTRVFPLGWKNSKGFNIGNITTQLRGEKPYSATDTIDYYLHTLFNGKNQGQSEISISSRHVPIIKTSGGKKNRMKKSKKSNKSKNNKTKKQHGKR